MKHIFYTLLFFTPALGFGQAADNVQQAVNNHVQFNANQIVSLAEAIPEDLYDWSPANDVRSVSKVLMHVASANYFILSLAGAEIPEGVNPMMMETEITGKEAVIQALNDSFEWTGKALMAIDDEALTEEATFPFPGEYNKQSAILIILSHVSDHKGQLVAYARSNDIAPPWSE